jgi:hypothetical protein
MLTCYVTRDELYRFSDISRYISDDAVIDAALGTSAYTLAETLRGRGIDPSRVQIPKMFEPVDDYEAIAYLAGTHTTSQATGGNTSRLVLDLRTAVTSGVTVTLEGSQDGTIWRTVTGAMGTAATIDVQADGVYSVQFVPRHTYSRATLTCTETVSASLYLVDTAPDACIRWGAVASALMPLIDPNTTVEAVYAEALRRHEEALSKLTLDYDANNDGEITEADAVRMNTLRAYR